MHGLPSPGGEHKFGAWRSLDVSFSSLPIYLVRRMYKINHNLVRFTSVLVVSLVHSWDDHPYTSGVLHHSTIGAPPYMGGEARPL